MTTLSPATAATPVRPRRLRGLAWLVVRQHRTVLILCAAATVLGSAWTVYRREAALDILRSAHWPTLPRDTIDPAVRSRVADDLNSFGAQIGFLPLLFGVFLGAPLIAAEREQGTARLVTTQSVPRGRWLRWKLCSALALAALTSAVLGLLYGWWWDSAGPLASPDWLNGALFDSSGPVLVATSLFTTSLGIAIGTLVRRVVPAMALTFLVSGVALFAGDILKVGLATPRRLVTPLETVPPPATWYEAVQVDQWVGTASGRLYGWSTCVHDASPDTCRADLGIVNRVWEYLGPDQMAGMQWIAAGVLVGLSAVLMGSVLWWTRRGSL
ncbi:ABC transporter permease subunit [Streptomyces sp. NPDC089915]|uniref:ABC transporter permease subunit n=1 Tax=Streptomyces sp. NPDC089915 TaxID=3155186 RepID=UPI00343090ED